MLFFLIIFLCLGTGYLAALLFLWLNYQKIPFFEPKISTKKLAVVVAARNEAANIHSLLQALAQQTYPCSVYLVDDHSQDDTVAIAQNFLLEMDLKILKNEGQGKKTALLTAIKAAQDAEIILSTDADCVMEKNWTKTILGAFENPKIELVSSPVAFWDSKNIFENLLQTELASLIGVGAVSFFLQKPIMCNGANLAFRRETFLKIGVFDDNLHLASGDDEFLMRKIALSYPQSFCFIKNPEALVRTQSPKNIGAFLAQRLRWASKWKNKGNWTNAILAFGIFLFYGLLLALSFFYPVLILGFLCLKSILEWLFLRDILRLCLSAAPYWTVIIWQLLYPFYAILVGLLAQKNSYIWKGRRYET